MGDRVWLKLQPYAQGSVVSRVSPKLAFRYFRPYEVEAKIGAVAYKLKLPPGSSVHDVFHVSLLKPVKGTGVSAFSPLPADLPSVQTPQLILDHRAITRHNRIYHQLLIKWMDLLAEMATWEDEDDLLQRFLEFTAWG